jgi:DNA-binding MarR family transcriptional regulator
LLDDELAKYNLNTTGYGIILKCADSANGRISAKALVSTFFLKPSTITQAVNKLREQNMITSATSGEDARFKNIQLTETARKTLAQVERNLRGYMRAHFNPKDEPNRRESLGSALYIGGQIGGLWSETLRISYPTSTNLVAAVWFMKRAEALTRAEAGLSLTEARILQNLDEHSRPMRLVDISRQLYLAPDTVTRTAASLNAKGHTFYLKSDIERKAVYLDMTSGGRTLCCRITKKLFSFGAAQYLGLLSEKDVKISEQVREFFLEDLERRRIAKIEKLLNELHPV